MHFGLALLGALPALLAMAYVDRLDAKRPEPRSLLRRMALLGALSVIPAGVTEWFLEKKLGGLHTGYGNALFRGFVVAASVEELCKLLCLRFFIWNRPEFDERLDGIVYATRAGLGFALVENVMYLAFTKSTGAFIGMFIGRAILAVPGHAVFAGVMGYFAARRRFDKKGPGIVGGYLLAVLLHGAYDAAIMAVPTAISARDYMMVLGFFCVPLLVVGLGLVTVRIMAHRALIADDLAFAAAEPAAQAAGDLQK